MLTSQSKQSHQTVYVALFSLLIFLLLIYYSNNNLLQNIYNSAIYWINKFPRNINQVSSLSSQLASHSTEFPIQTLFAICSLFIFLQTFAVPGTVMLSAACGYLYGLPIGLLIVASCSAVGASFCYTLSKILFKSIMYSSNPNSFASKYSDKLSFLRTKISLHKSNLFYYLLFLRITPLIPNWFINVSSPHLAIPLQTFFFATFFGVIPLSVIHVKTGNLLAQYGKYSDNNDLDFSVWNVENVLWMCFMAVCALVPILIKNKM